MRVNAREAGGRGAEEEQVRQEAGRQQVLANRLTFLAHCMRGWSFREEIAAKEAEKKMFVVAQERVTWVNPDVGED